MSYIRSTSNPEAAYIFSDGRHVHAWWDIPRPHANCTEMTIPTIVFDNVLKRWLDSSQMGAVKYRGLVVRWCIVNEKTGRVVPEPKPCNKHPMCKACRKILKKHLTERHRHVIRVEWKGKYAHFWPVTWEHIAEHERSVE